MTTVVNSQAELITAVTNNGATNITINFNIPSFFYTDAPTAAALRAIEALTLGNGTNPITIADNAFSTNVSHSNQFDFVSLETLTFNPNVTYGNAIFGVNNTTTATTLQGTSFPNLLIITFNNGTTIQGSELFGAYSSNGPVTAASLPSLQSIIIGQNVTFANDNVFGVTGTNDATVTGNTFTSLIAIQFNSTPAGPITINGDQFFGASGVEIDTINTPNITAASFPILPFLTFNAGLIVNGNQFFGITGAVTTGPTFSALQRISFASNITITGDKAFNLIAVPTGMQICIQANGFIYPSSTFNIVGGVSIVQNLTGSSGQNNRIHGLVQGADYVFNNQDYGPCALIQNPSSTNTVTSIAEMLATVFGQDGSVVQTDIIVTFDIPSTCYNDTTTVNGNGKRLRDAFQVLTKLTIGDGTTSVTVNNTAFSTTTTLNLPFVFLNLTELVLNANVTFGNAVFGAHNTGGHTLYGAEFPMLQKITFVTGCKVTGTELFGAYSNSGPAFTASLPALQQIIVQPNVQFMGDNTFGANAVNAVVTINPMPALTTLTLNSAATNNITITGNQFFGGLSSGTATLTSLSAPLLERLTFLDGLIIDGDNAFAQSRFTGLTIIAFQGGVSITGTNTFNNMTVQSSTDACIQNDGIIYPATTFNVTGGGTANLTNLNGSTGVIGSITFAALLNLSNFLFDREDYGNCNNTGLPIEIIYTDISADTPEALMQAFVAQLANGNTNIQFMNDVPPLFWTNPDVLSVCPLVVNLAFGPGIKIHDQAFGYHATKTMQSPPTFTNLQTITFGNGSVAAGDQIFGIYTTTAITQTFPELTTITFDDNMQITGDDLFGVSASTVPGFASMHFPKLTSIVFGNNILINGNRVFGSANYTSGTVYASEMPLLTTFTMGNNITIAGNCFLGAMTQYEPANTTTIPADNGGLAVGARMETLTSFIVGNDLTIKGQCFCGAASPSGGQAIGALFDQLQTLSFGNKTVMQGGQAFGATESNSTSVPPASAVGAICPRLMQLSIGEKGNISGTAAFSATRSGNPQNIAVPPTFGTPSTGNGANMLMLAQLPPGMSTVDLVSTLDLANTTQIQTAVSIGRGTVFNGTTFGFQGSSSNPSPSLVKVQGASSDGNTITLSDNSKVALSGSFGDTSVLPINPLLDMTMLTLCWAALMLAIWMTLVISGN